MTGWVANLTAAALLAHSLLGCCWHHEHETPEAACLVTAGGCGHWDHHGATGHERNCRHQSEDHSQPRESGCQGGSCALASLQRVREATSWAKSSCGTPVPLLANAASVPAQKSVRETVVDAADRHPPVRIHLLHEILLI